VLCCLRSRRLRCFRRAELSAPPKRRSRRSTCSASRPASSASPLRRAPAAGSSREAESQRLQAAIVADLIRRGIEVHAFNQRTVTGILEMIRMLGAIVDPSERAEELVATLKTRLAKARRRSEYLPKRPRVFFEQWDDPLISAI